MKAIEKKTNKKTAKKTTGRGTQTKRKAQVRDRFCVIVRRPHFEILSWQPTAELAIDVAERKWNALNRSERKRWRIQVINTPQARYMLEWDSEELLDKLYPTHTWFVCASESGDIIESCKTEKEADATIERYEDMDREEGIYEPRFYEAAPNNKHPWPSFWSYSAAGEDPKESAERDEIIRAIEQGSKNIKHTTIRGKRIPYDTDTGEVPEEVLMARYTKYGNPTRDDKRKAKRTVPVRTPKSVRGWWTRPGRYDLTGIDDGSTPKPVKKLAHPLRPIQAAKPRASAKAPTTKQRAPATKPTRTKTVPKTEKKTCRTCQKERTSQRK